MRTYLALPLGLLLLAASLLACDSATTNGLDASIGDPDATTTGPDATTELDATAHEDATTVDVGFAPDATNEDATTTPDTGTPLPDSGTPDTGVRDAGTTPDAGTPSADPGAAGPYTTTMATDTVTRGRRDTPVAAHIPAVPSGAHVPLVIFLPGFQLDSVRYSALAEHVASHGFVVVRADPSASIFSTNHVEMAADAQAVIDWALATGSPVASIVDPTKVGIMGHSLGGKLSTMVAHDDPRIRALLAIDPVNGGSPLTGYSMTLPDIVPDWVTPLTIPVGFAGETTNGSGGIGGQACAPTDQNFQTFYDAATGASWAAEWDFAGADHMDFVDDTTSCGFTCSACTDGTAAEADVQANLHRLAAAFFRRHFGGETAMEPYLTGAQLPSAITARHHP